MKIKPENKKFFQIQLDFAKDTLKRGGEPELWKHAQIGKTCGCGDCFTCAAFVVWRNLPKNIPKAQE